MRYEVYFRGGPLGGETKFFDSFPGHRLQVPGLTRFSITREQGAGEPPLWMTETYELHRTRDSGVFEFRWVNPNEAVLIENRALKSRIQELEQLERLLEAMRPFFRSQL